MNPPRVYLRKVSSRLVECVFKYFIDKKESLSLDRLLPPNLKNISKSLPEQPPHNRETRLQGFTVIDVHLPWLRIHSSLKVIIKLDSDCPPLGKRCLISIFLSLARRSTKNIKGEEWDAVMAKPWTRFIPPGPLASAVNNPKANPSNHYQLGLRFLLHPNTKFKSFSSNGKKEKKIGENRRRAEI